MAHVRKDTLVSGFEWAKHLKRFGKRRVAKAERKAAIKEIKKNINLLKEGVNGNAQYQGNEW